MKKRIIGGALALAALGAFADYTWKGANCTLNGDWSLASNWSDAHVPTGDEVALVTCGDGQLHHVGLTPPTDFTGTIKVMADATDWDIWHPCRVELTVLDGATWMVAGNGYVYATPNIAAHISSSFTGTVVIPKGSSFEAPTTLNANVKFAGDGILTVSETRRLTTISGFTGTLVWGGDPALAPDDTTLLQGRTVELADGASIAYDKGRISANAAVEIKDWNEDPSAWSMVGATWATSAKYDLDTRPPHANADGSLALVTDAAQYRTVAYTGQKLRWCDSWGLSFRWTPELPTPSKFTEKGAYQEWAGVFGVFFSTNTTCAGYTKNLPMKTGGGFLIYEWDKPYLSWYRNGSHGCEIFQSRLNEIGSVDFRKPIDFTVTFQNGLYTVQMRQGEKYLVTSRYFLERYTVPSTQDGYYICFSAVSDWWDSDNNIPWSTQQISNFKGWYRAREAGRWQDEGRLFYPFTSDNAMARIYTADGVYTENPFGTDGSFHLQDYTDRTRTVLISTLAVANNRPTLYNFDLVCGTGTGGENTEITKYGLMRSSYPISDWQYDWTRLAYYDIDSYSNPLMVTTYWYGGWQKYYLRYRVAGVNVHAEESNNYFGHAKMIKDRTQHVALINDGSAGLYYQMFSTINDIAVSHWAPSATERSGWANGDGVRFVAEHYSGWGRVDADLKNLTVKVLKDNQNCYLSGEMAVKAGATATFTADAHYPTSATEAAEVAGVTLAEGATFKVATGVSGSKVIVDCVAASGPGATFVAETPVVLKGEIVLTGENIPETPLALSGSATFAGDTLTIVIPEAWRKMRCGTVKLLKAEGLTLPGNVRIVTDAGTDITARTQVSTEGGLVSANWTHGMTLFVY